MGSLGRGTAGWSAGAAEEAGVVSRAESDKDPEAPRTVKQVGHPFPWCEAHWLGVEAGFQRGEAGCGLGHWSERARVLTGVFRHVAVKG